MTTATEIIARAFRKIGVSGSGEALEAEELDAGLDALNMMMHGWKLKSVDTEHTTLDYTDTFPLGPEFEEGTVYLLANRLSPDYAIPLAFDADDWFRSMEAAYLTIPTVDLPTSLQFLPSQRTRGY